MAVDDVTVDAIIQLKESLLKRDKDDSFDSDSSDSQIPSNRGRKLKRKAAHVNLERLRSHDDGPVLEIVEYANKRRAVVRKKATPVYEDDHDQDRQDEADDPYQGIDLDQLLSPITHPSQLPNHPAISKAYTRTTLATLARRALDFICTETTKQAQIGNLLSLFLGDDGRFIKSDDLNLPTIQLPSVPIGTIYPRSASEEQESIPPSQDSTAALDSQAKVNGTVGPRRTRNQASGDLDPFYALPTLKQNQDVGCPPEFAEEMRQLADLAVQKSEEYTRCLVQVRMGLLRADRYRRKVYKWCREIGGELSDDDDYDQPNINNTSNSSSNNVAQQKGS